MKLLENAPNYKDIELTKFHVSCTLASASIQYDPPTLDGLLAYAVVQEVTRGKGLPATREPYYIPLPLEQLWRCPETLAPLWNATQFFPLGENEQQTRYWHKRAFGSELLKPARSGKPANPRFTQGPHKEYRIPLPQQSCLKWCAFGVGDILSVVSLLKNVSHFGKKRTQGHGVVAEWCIEAIDDFGYHRDGKLIKAFPVAFPEVADYVDVHGGIVFSRRETAWTPPYWNETLFQPCIV